MRLTPQLSLIKRLSRYAGWAAVLASGILSLVPGSLRPQTAFPHSTDHLVAYLAIAALLSVGYAGRVSPGVVALLLMLMAAGLEVAQFFVPGRHAGWADIVASSAGTAGGGFAAWLFLRFAYRVAGGNGGP